MAANDKPTAPAEAKVPTALDTPAAAWQAEPPADDTLEAEVARGRSVVTDDGLKQAGARVALPRGEARKLMALGYLVDPEAPRASEGNGPSFERRG